MNLKTRTATILRKWAHKLDPQPYVEPTNNGWTIKTQQGTYIATIAPGASL